ncbi:MAG: LnmK family bifunctional acyltransferase/decarboxylase [Allosphingosinicella sp.]
MSAEGLAAALAAVEGWEPGAETRSWSELGLDSFGLLSLRFAVEEALGRELSDAEWLAARTPADLLRLEAAAAGPDAAGFAIEETVEIGMPQMALGGLSESWLFRHLGDLHWRLVGRALGVAPHAMRGGEGGRIFPAFNRVRVESSPLADFREGAALRFEAKLVPAGGGLCFAEMRGETADGCMLSATLMSTLVAPAGEGGGRLAPAVPAAGESGPAGPFADFAAGFAQRRAQRDAPRPVLERRAYPLQPQYDFNGVGLLYCAAYPMIADLSEMAASGRGPKWAAEASTRRREIFYFGNAGLDTELEWRLHRRQDGDSPSLASLVADGGRVIAEVETLRAPR